MEEVKTPIIVKKIKKGGGHHGGAWKVAYADFVTAMMAFFLLLWLLSQTSEEQKASLSQYFKSFSIFSQGGTSITIQDGSGTGAAKSQDMEMMDPLTPPAEETEMSAEDFKEKFRQVVEEKLSAMQDQVIVDLFEGGVRIQMVDIEGSAMFPLGKAEPTDKARQILKVVAEQIKELPNRIAIEGHTDATPYSTSKITNWELSTDRASAARRQLESYGIPPGRVARVVGYADNELLVADNPRDPRNRRISVILLFGSSKKVK